MSGVDVRRAQAGDLARYGRTVWTGFGERPDDAGIEEARRFAEAGSPVVALDGDAIVGTALAFATHLTMPGGGDAPVGALTDVVVLPTHRRRGVMRRMMDLVLGDLASGGAAAAVLVASEATIYRRFGFGAATRAAGWTLDRSHGALIDRNLPAGGWRLLEPGEAAPLLPPLHEAARRRGCGDIRRTDAWWRLWQADPEGRIAGDPPRFHAVRGGDDGVPDAAIVYRIERPGAAGSERVLAVNHLLAASDEAERAAWAYLLGVDGVGSLRLEGPPDPLLGHMLADPRRLHARWLADGLWVRPIDIPALLGARAGRCDGEVVLEVADTALPRRGGRFAVRGAAGRVECARTRRRPDLSLDVADLGALVLGAHAATGLVRAGRAAEARTGAAARVDALLAWSPEPYLATPF